MRCKADDTAYPSRRGVRAADLASYFLIAGAVVLGCQIVIQPIIQRGSVEAAIRIAPTSSLVLRRAAEAELAAGRNDNAAALSRDALARSPFDVRALRVAGLTKARAGREDEADDILTLAGNWSLRDDPSHAWLVEHRLRKGDYASSFAHADTLVRRREDIQPQVFRLFTVAGTEDPERSLPVVASLLADSPPWRRAYLDGLNTSPEGLRVAAGLAVLLQKGRAPFTDAELGRFYIRLLRNQQLEALRLVREHLNRPAANGPVTNGDFDALNAPEPFQWSVAHKAGVTAEIVADDLRTSNAALRVDYDGYSPASRITEQLIFLSPGSHSLAYEVRTELGDPAGRLAWRIRCVPADRTITSRVAATRGAGAWTRITARLEVPPGCPAQSLRLDAVPGDRRARTIVWFDRISITPGASVAE